MKCKRIVWDQCESCIRDQNFLEVWIESLSDFFNFFETSCKALILTMELYSNSELENNCGNELGKY